MAHSIRLYVLVLSVLVLLVSLVPCRPLALAEDESQTVRIGVYIRTGFASCLEEWMPVADRLSKEMPGYDFVILPLANREDVYEYLKTKKIDFLVANPAVYLCTEERFGTSALCGTVNDYDSSEPRYTGCLIRKADRKDLATLQDLRGQRLAAVKSWSLTGWIAQWRTLSRSSIDPIENMRSVQFEGTHPDVIQAVLDGVVDVGAVASDVLGRQIAEGLVDPKSLFVFDRKGNAVPLDQGVVPSTDDHPYLVFAKAAATPDPLAVKVQKILIESSDAADSPITWTVPQNYEKVRDVLRDLMGDDYAYSNEMIPRRKAAMLVPMQIIIVVSIALVLTMILFVAWRRARRRENIAKEGLRAVHTELKETRANKTLIEKILAHVRCGLDIINEHDEIIYVTPGIEHRYGPWRGKKCYEYYWNMKTPCEHCPKRALGKSSKGDEPCDGGCHVSFYGDKESFDEPPAEKFPSKTIQVPFYDENGRWLYARVHLPPEIFTANTNATATAAEEMATSR